MLRSIFFYENEELTFISILRIFLLVIVLFFILIFPISTFGNLSFFIFGIIYSLQFFAIFLIWTPYFNEKERKHLNAIYSYEEKLGISAALLFPLLGIFLVFFFIRDKRNDAVNELKRLHEQKLQKKKEESEKKKAEKKKREERWTDCRIKINSSKKYIEDLKSKKALKLIEEAEAKIERDNFDEIEKLVNEAKSKAYNEFLEEQKKKGFVEYNGKWGTPEQVKTWKEIDIGLSNNFANLTHFEFEQFIGKLFQKMGYQTTVTKKTGDYGIDVIAKKDDDAIAIQVKKNSQGNNVGDIVVQNTLGGMWKYKANKAIIITTSDFTTMAHEQARGAPIELWNKKTLHQMVRKHFVES